MNRRTLTHRFYRSQWRLFLGTARLFGFDMPRQTEVSLPMEAHGDDTAAYYLDATGLDANSIIYSFGIGADVSFDRSVIEKLGATVHAFDPTEQSKRFVEASKLSERFRFHQFALGPQDGEMKLSHILTEHPEQLAGTLVDLGRRECGASEVPVHRLETIMKKLGHDRIDVLKVDVQGVEYDILGDLIRLAPVVPQLLIEFHPDILNWERYPTVLGRFGWRETRRAIDKLRSAGYRISHISGRGVDFSFKYVAPESGRTLDRSDDARSGADVRLK